MEEKNSWIAVTSFVLVICGFVWLIFSVVKLVAYILFISGILFGIVGLIHTIRTGLKGRGLAWAAFFLGILGFFVTLLSAPIY
ncbi:MAG TPA: hypothetical protein PLT60_03625 [Candidatus Pacearchaeota archaeon]|jgi:hypothetical protein|nr:hypothetical protein [Candidatus Pacearchaeota archaeon]HOH04160.1 hypothetical protein [Candidatus Pacearchaeota archaeon]HPX74928.1 hypothetical protein [Candidatus Pacearchaeota archaeon]HQC61280.1 hypothetical protein [Candidatus Pacearchaeota archaeon]